jgi:hypothetical protein
MGVMKRLYYAKHLTDKKTNAAELGLRELVTEAIAREAKWTLTASKPSKPKPTQSTPRRKAQKPKPWQSGPLAVTSGAVAKPPWFAEED